MAKTVNRLTDLKVKKAGVGLYPDGDGLYLQVRGNTARSWLYKYMLNGKAREMGLGSYPSTTLEDARAKRDKYKAIRQGGKDPIEARKAEETAKKLEESRAITFSDAVTQFIKAKSSGWRNEKHRQQWTNTLATYVEPSVGDLPVRSIDVAMVQQVLEPIWTTKTETATRVRQRIEAVLDWAKDHGLPDRRESSALAGQTLPTYSPNLRMFEGSSIILPWNIRLFPNSWRSCAYRTIPPPVLWNLSS